MLCMFEHCYVNIVVLMKSELGEQDNGNPMGDVQPRGECAVPNQ